MMDGAGHLAHGANFYELREWTDEQWQQARAAIQAQNEKDRAQRSVQNAASIVVSRAWSHAACETGGVTRCERSSCCKAVPKYKRAVVLDQVFGLNSAKTLGDW